MNRVLAIAAAALIAAAVVASPALAKRQSSPTPGGIWVDLLFADAGGKHKTVVIPLTLYRATDADKTCADNKGLQVLAKAAAQDDLTIASMTLLEAKCETDGHGKVKVAIGAWPKGKGPGYVEQPGLSVKVNSDVFKGAPAVVVLHFVATNGRHVNTVFGYTTKPVFYLKTCAASLAAKVPSLIKLAQVDRVGTASPGEVRPYSLYGLKFTSAECVPPPKRIGDLGWPETNVEFAFIPPGFN